MSSFTPAQIAAGVKVESSEFDAATIYQNQLWLTGELASTRWSLRTFVPRNGSPRFHQVYFTRMYTAASWIFYAQASDDAAGPHDVISISRKVIDCSAGGFTPGCTYWEDVGIQVSDAFLREREQRGFRLQVEARNGTGAAVLAIPANYIQGHLAALPK